VLNAVLDAAPSDAEYCRRDRPVGVDPARLQEEATMAATVREAIRELMTRTITT
jgi:hypothetical protein